MVVISNDTNIQYFRKEDNELSHSEKFVMRIGNTYAEKGSIFSLLIITKTYYFFTIWDAAFAIQ